MNTDQTIADPRTPNPDPAADALSAVGTLTTLMRSARNEPGEWKAFSFPAELAGELSDMARKHGFEVRTAPHYTDPGHTAVITLRWNAAEG